MALVLDKCLLTAIVHITFISQNVTSSVPCSFWYQIKTSHYCKFRPLHSFSGKFMAQLFCFPLNIHRGGCAEQLCCHCSLQRGDKITIAPHLCQGWICSWLTPLHCQKRPKTDTTALLKREQKLKRFLIYVIEDIRCIKSDFFMLWRSGSTSACNPLGEAFRSITESQHG